jgi:7-cyano-7-deazaguanine synthase in queuosine biosynthesis
MLLLSIAAAHGARLFAPDLFGIVIGCNADDAQAFPDCREPFLRAATVALSASLAGAVGKVVVLAPWVGKTKRQIAEWAHRAGAWQDVLDSQSCYAGTRCGECDACKLRADAIGSEDGAWIPRLCGGDYKP